MNKKAVEEIKDIMSFESNDFGTIRTVAINNIPYFVGKDVAMVLGYAIPQKAILEHVDVEDCKVLTYKAFSKTEIANLWGDNDFSNKTLINESGLYSLVLSSKLPQARKFKHWITSEVLPQIRKTGSFSMAVPKTFAEALYLAAKQQEQIEEQQRTIELQQKKIEEDAPHVQFSEAVLASEKAILISTLAKMIAQNGIEIGGKRLFKWMRKNEYLGTSGRNKNIPTQKAIDLGVLFIEERTIDTGWDSRIVRTPMVTGKGQKYFINKFLMQENH